MSTIAMNEYELMKDSKYRMYVAAVDKALKNFEYTSEWADLISALGKLNKVRKSTQFICKQYIVKKDQKAHTAITRHIYVLYQFDHA